MKDTGAPDGSDRARKLVHGVINHGEQYLASGRRREPTSYFGPKSGIGQAIAVSRNGSPQKVGVVGLGDGRLSLEREPSQKYRYLDLRPVVRRAIEAFRRHAVIVEREEDEDSGFFSSSYVLVSSDAETLRRVAGEPLPPFPGFRLWTGDYSNLFGILE